MWLWGVGLLPEGHQCVTPTPLIPSLRARCLQGFSLTTLSQPLVPVPRPLAWRLAPSTRIFPKRTKLPKNLKALQTLTFYLHRVETNLFETPSDKYF